MADRRVTPLQEGDGRGDGGQITVELFVKATQGGERFLCGMAFTRSCIAVQAGRRKQFEHQLASAMSSCVASIPRERRKPVR
jgi:hypothetical protein